MRGRITLIFKEWIRKPLNFGDNLTVIKTTNINIFHLDLK
jgi:hypothetical protein